MEAEQQRSNEEALDWDGWVVAYTGIQGAFPVQVFTGYMGRFDPEEDCDDMMNLHDAIEFSSTITPNGNGGEIGRSTHGMPLEFMPGGHQLRVRPMAILELDGLTEEQRRTFDAARREALQVQRDLVPFRPGLAVEGPPRIVVPGGPLPNGPIPLRRPR